jgi:Autotransporter beta-domain
MYFSRLVSVRWTAVAAVFAVTAGTTGPATALSDGCAGVNQGAFNFSIKSGDFGNRSLSGFVAGNVITFTATRVVIPGSDGARFRLDGNAKNQLYESLDGNAATETKVYTVTGTDDLTLTAVLESFGPEISLTATCVAGGQTATSTDSQKLRALQIVGTKIVAQTSGAATSDAVEAAITDGLGGSGGGNMPPATGGPAFNLGAGSSQMSRLGGVDTSTSPPARSGWKSWASLRGSGFDQDSRNATTGAVSGTQFNATFGVGRLVAPGILVGILGGYETFDYDANVLGGHLKGDGWTTGGYLGARLAPALRFDAAVAWSGLTYDAKAGTASGSFDASRWLLSSGLTGSYKAGTVLIEPSARLYALWESQDAWTDSLGTRQGARSFDTARASLGGKISTPWQISSATVTPYAGLYGDYRFSSDDALPINAAQFGIRDGWSARITGGLGVRYGNGVTLSLDGEVGGLGTNDTTWTIGGRGALPF